MLNITIGQYYPADSLIHRLDARVKLIGTFVYIVMLFIASSFWSYVFAAAFLAAVVYITNIPPKMMLRGLRSIIFIAAFTAFLNIFFTQGETVLFSIWKITVTLEGVLFAIKLTVRLALIIIGSSVLTLTTQPIQLTDAIEYILHPLTHIGVQAHEIAMTMTIALRFIPTLLEEMDRIMKAQMARGADFETGGLMQKAKSLVPLLVPLFISAFDRAYELAMAMEARCYRGGEGRTKFKQMRMGKRDYQATVCLIVLIVGIVILNRV